MRSFWEQIGVVGPMYHLAGHGSSSSDTTVKLGVPELTVRTRVSLLLSVVKPEDAGLISVKRDRQCEALTDLNYHPDAVALGLAKPLAYNKLCALIEHAQRFHPPIEGTDQ